jgi:hypothetical protein
MFCFWRLAEIPKPQANVRLWGKADIVPTKQRKKPAKAKALSPLWRISFQTCVAQNFSFFVFGGQHGGPRSKVEAFAIGSSHFNRAGVSDRLNYRFNFTKLTRLTN